MATDGRIKWHLVYKEIAAYLVRFYEQHGSQAPFELARRVGRSTAFQNLNPWFRKFTRSRSIGLDPIHVFSSFNGNSSSNTSRENRIKVLLSIFGMELKFDSIDFSGCPTPLIVKMVSLRPVSNYQEIWQFFHKAFKESEALTPADFEPLGQWYGVRFNSLSIFLFWIRSDIFLPFDKNTRQYLEKKGVEIPPKFKPADYLLLIKNIQTYNYKSDDWRDAGIYREIARVAYEEIVLKNTSIALTAELRSFLKNPLGRENLGLKIIALKVLDECDTQHLKVLTNSEDKIFYFEKAFSIAGDQIVYNSEKDLDLFSIESAGNTRIKVNVTAIVGKNGSGKSTLIDLFSKTINNVIARYSYELKAGNVSIENGIATELYYLLNHKIYCLKVTDEEVTLRMYRSQDQNVYVAETPEESFKKEDFDAFFYTLSINYSHYALNSKDMGNWIEKLFSKKDGYQAPITFNPFRNKGNFDINRETELVKSRLISLLFEPVSEDDLGIRLLTDSQQAARIDFETTQANTRNFFNQIELNTGKDMTEIIEFVQEKVEVLYDLYGITPPEDESEVLLEVEKYIFYRLDFISENYNFNIGYNLLNLYIDETKWKEYLEIVLADSSYLTEKLRQALNYLKYGFYPKSERFQLKLDDLNDMKEEALEDFPELEDIQLIELLPPPIFRAEIKLTDKNVELQTADYSTLELSDFNELSSGEKQQIYSVSSILYHLRNLNSVEETNDEVIKYKNVNLILDEIELYYHPEYQRKYLGHLLRMLSKAYLDEIDSINICLITHSPYVLSDIPDFYTLRLNRGKTEDNPEKRIQTFGANIHDLLSDSFFMDQGFMGEHAKEVIQELIRFLKETIKKVPYSQSNYSFNWTPEFAKQVIEVIGEPLLKFKIEELYNTAFPEHIDEESAKEQIRKFAKQFNLPVNFDKE